MLSTFACTYVSCTYFIQCNFILHLLLLYEFLLLIFLHSLYILDISFIRHIYCKCFIPAYGLPFTNTAFWWTKVFNFEDVFFINFSSWLMFFGLSIKYFSIPSLSRVLWIKIKLNTYVFFYKTCNFSFYIQILVCRK